MNDIVAQNGLIATVAICGIGGLMYLLMSMSTRSATSSSRAVAARRPGWIARRRARAGIRHRRDRVGIGYTSATRAMHLSLRELAGHGAVFGGPGSGKTMFLQLLVEAAAGEQPVVILDPKGSPALTATVRAHGGQVWTLDGKLPVDLLDPRPWQVPDLLLEAEEYSSEARVFRDAAHQRALWAAWALALNHQPMNLTRLRRLLDRDKLQHALEPFAERDERVDQWLEQLAQRDGVADSGARDLERSIGTLLDGVAMRGSLGTGPEALRLEDVLATNGLVLFSLDAADYPHATRKIASWVLLAMGRLARQLPELGTTALLLVDEVGALGHQARHLRGLVGRAREAGLAVVLATQGPSDLEAVDRALLPQVLQDTAWQLVFRQGSPQDADRMQALFGQAWTDDLTRYSDGRNSSRKVERPRVPIDEWMNGLEPGDAWLRVAPVDGRWRQDRVRVAKPRVRKLSSETALGFRFGNHVEEQTEWVSETKTDSSTAAAENVRQEHTEPRMLPQVPPECPADLIEKMGADVLAKVERRWSKRRELGPCFVWRDGEPTIQAAGGLYGRIYDPVIKRSDAAHRVVWRRVYGLIPLGPNEKPLEVDHRCKVTLCQRPDHLRLLTKRDNVKERGSTRRRPQAATEIQAKVGNSGTEAFAIALFAGIDRPAVEQRTVSLDDLRQLLSKFEVLSDKRRGRCWSPTRYADGIKSRGNAGVAEVSALVFDLDRVPPDPDRLAGVYWLGHTTWSHKPEAPKWRVVIPLAQPVSAANWGDVWRCARAALCPEADPSCKDPSRQYYLPSHSGGVSAKATCHDGPLLDPSTLPELPAEERAELRRSPSAKSPRKTTVGDRSRGEAYMDGVISKLASMAPNSGRNVALNGAAWTLGRWIAAGALDQADVENELYGAAEANGLVADDGARQCWATIRSGLGAGLQQPIDLDADDGPPVRRTRGRG